MDLYIYICMYMYRSTLYIYIDDIVCYWCMLIIRGRDTINKDVYSMQIYNAIKQSRHGSNGIMLKLIDNCDIKS